MMPSEVLSTMVVIWIGLCFTVYSQLWNKEDGQENDWPELATGLTCHSRADYIPWLKDLIAAVHQHYSSAHMIHTTQGLDQA
jgi:hypothetical protein